MNNKDVCQAFLVNKVSSRREYFAFFIAQYQQYEQLNDEQIKSFLECSDDNFFRLALCRVPDMQADSFAEHVQKIATFANVPAIKLIKMLRRVLGLEVMQQAVENMDEERRFLLAARSKAGDEEDTSNEHEEP